MSNVALLLGPIAFQAFEVPANINIGGAQRLAIHRLPGGTRVIDVLGRDDSDITFSGTFSGSDATLRARLVDEMRMSGLAMPLTWDVFFYSVIIKKFEADYRSGWWIPYRMTCTVVNNGLNDAVISVISLADGVLSDVTTALRFAAIGGIDLSDAQTAIGMQGATVRGTTAYSSTLDALTNANTLVGSGIDRAGSMLGTSSWSISAQSLPCVASAFASVVSAAHQMSSLTVAQTYIGRAGSNLANAST
jgi:hypothetical protein